jgi:hypothetical protein
MKCGRITSRWSVAPPWPVTVSPWRAAERERYTGRTGRPSDDSWDVFVSFKNLGPDGLPTEDSRLARQVSDHLSQVDLSVFFGELSLESLGESAYQEAIDDALDAAKVLVAVGTSAENLESGGSATNGE